MPAELLLYAAEVLARKKVGILNFLKAVEFKADDVLRHYLVASCDYQESVSRLGDDLLKRRCEGLAKQSQIVQSLVEVEVHLGQQSRCQ